jgi:carbon-monoxide dehydrogenase small subunit
VATIEGFDADNELTPVQEAFIEAGAFQCGYCTSGFIIMATKLLDEHPEPTDHQIKHYLSGNLCRCAAYPEIIQAVKLAAHKRKMRATPARA